MVVEACPKPGGVRSEMSYKFPKRREIAPAAEAAYIASARNPDKAEKKQFQVGLILARFGQRCYFR